MSNENQIMLIAQEECAEVIQAVSKVFRFGWDATHPDTPEYSNKNHLEEEIGDLMCMFSLMKENGLIDWSRVEVCSRAKREKLAKWSNIK